MAGKPVARLGDPTAHGGSIAEGDETVLIGGKPAARAGDNHNCSIPTHVGGPIIPPCAATVLVGGQPLARVSDKATCHGPDDTISEGLATVMVGSGGPAAAMSEAGQAVLAKYEKQLTGKLQITAKDLAAGKLSKTLTAKEMQSWVTGLMMDLPLGDTPVGQTLARSLGLDGEDLKLSPKQLLKEQGKEYGDKVKDWVKGFKDDHPGLFWSAAVLAALGGGAMTYSQGTSVLKKVGVKPQYKHAFFKKRVEASAALDLGPKLSDPKLELASKQKVGDRLTLWQKGTLQGKDFSSLGLAKYSLGADYDVPLGDTDQKLKAGLAYSHDGLKDTDQVSGYLHGGGDGYTYGVDALVTPGSGDHKVSGYFGKQFSDNGSIQGYVQHQDMGGVSQTSAGVLLRFSF